MQKRIGRTRYPVSAKKREPRRGKKPRQYCPTRLVDVNIPRHRPSVLMLCYKNPPTSITQHIRSNLTISNQRIYNKYIKVLRYLFAETNLPTTVKFRLGSFSCAPFNVFCRTKKAFFQECSMPENNYLSKLWFRGPVKGSEGTIHFNDNSTKTDNF